MDCIHVFAWNLCSKKIFSVPGHQKKFNGAAAQYVRHAICEKNLHALAVQKSIYKCNKVLKGSIGDISAEIFLTWSDSSRYFDNETEEYYIRGINAT